MKPRRTFIKNILLAGGGSMLLPWKSLANTLLSSYETQQELALRTTCWKYVHYPALLFAGNYGAAEWETKINQVVALGFNSIGISIHWSHIYRDQAAINAGGYWTGDANNPTSGGSDHCINYAISKGLKVILTVRLRHKPINPYFIDTDRSISSTNSMDIGGDGRTAMSLASPSIGKAIHFLQSVGERYKTQQNGGHILAIVPVHTMEASIGYNTTQLDDYNPYFLTEYRAYLSSKYAIVSELNTAWGSSYTTFSDIVPTADFTTFGSKDWYNFKSNKIKQFVDSASAALNSISGITTPYRLLLNYPVMGEDSHNQASNLDYTYHGSNANVWGIQQQNTHITTGYQDSLGSTNAIQAGKVVFNEYTYSSTGSDYPSGNIVSDSVSEIKTHLEQGANGIAFVGDIQNATFQQIVQTLQSQNVWNNAVVQRLFQASCSTHVKLSELIGLGKVGIQSGYYTPFAAAQASSVQIYIDRDLSSFSLPIIVPINGNIITCTLDIISILGNSTSSSLQVGISSSNLPTTLQWQIQNSSNQVIQSGTLNTIVDTQLTIPLSPLLLANSYNLVLVANGCIATQPFSIAVPSACPTPVGVAHQIVAGRKYEYIFGHRIEPTFNADGTISDTFLSITGLAGNFPEQVVNGVRTMSAEYGDVYNVYYFINGLPLLDANDKILDLNNIYFPNGVYTIQKIYTAASAYPEFSNLRDRWNYGGPIANENINPNSSQNMPVSRFFSELIICITNA